MEMTHQQVADGFRRLADIIEANPEMGLPYDGISSAILLFCHNKDKFAATVRAFGQGQKDHDSDTLIFNPDFPLRVQVRGFKNNICEQRARTVMVREQVIQGRPAEPERVIPAHEETVTEYVCAPFLEA